MDYAAGGIRKTVYAYDVLELYAETIVNPLGHVTKETHDVGTGVLVRKEGPQSKKVQGANVLATTTMMIDGLGRIRAEAVPVDDATAGYTTQVRRVTTYEDNMVPARVTLYTLEDFADLRWRSELRA